MLAKLCSSPPPEPFFPPGTRGHHMSRRPRCEGRPRCAPNPGRFIVTEQFKKEQAASHEPSMRQPPHPLPAPQTSRQAGGPPACRRAGLPRWGRGGPWAGQWLVHGPDACANRERGLPMNRALARPLTPAPRLPAGRSPPMGARGSSGGPVAGSWCQCAAMGPSKLPRNRMRDAGYGMVEFVYVLDCRSPAPLPVRANAKTKAGVATDARFNV